MCSFQTLKIILSSFLTIFLSNQAFSEDNMGAAHPWGLNLREAFSPVMAEMISFHNALIWLIVIISLFVLALLAIIVVRFNAKSNPKASKTTHNTFIEIAWTVIPVLILVIMAVPSFKLLYKSDVIPEAHMTVKAIGHQWYWSYEYPDHGNFTYDAWLVQDKEDIDGEDRPYTRLLTTDTRVVVPVGKVIRVQMTSTDVLHSWAVPSLGVKKDAVPGRLNELWFEADREGIFYGQCSELCGTNHGYMPIEVHAVSEEEFLLWVEEAKENYDMVGNNLNLAKIKE
jgi:cytochrome c oxidase subunit 2